MSDLSDQGVTPEVEQSVPNYMEELVGEGKKYATDEDLAKGAYNANIHIGKLEAETAEFRRLAEEAKSKEDHLETIVNLISKPVEETVVEQPKVDPVVAEPTKEVSPMPNVDVDANLNMREFERLALDKYGDAKTAGEKMREYIGGVDDKMNVVTTLMRSDPNALISILPNVEVQKEMNPTGGTAQTGPAPNTLPVTQTEAMELFEKNRSLYNSNEFQNKYYKSMEMAEQLGIDYDKT